MMRSQSGFLAIRSLITADDEEGSITLNIFEQIPFDFESYTETRASFKEFSLKNKSTFQ